MGLRWKKHVQERAASSDIQQGSDNDKKPPVTETTGCEECRSYRLMAYGIERKGLTAPAEPIVDRNYTIFFEKFKTPKRFGEFDGVVVFQGIFEVFKEKADLMGQPYYDHSSDQDELDKRTKELQVLLQQGGFACFILCEPFIDRDRYEDYSGSDLAKVVLNIPSFDRDNFGGRVTDISAKRDEFQRFLKLYGAANTHFRHYNDEINWRIVAQCGSAVVSMVLMDQVFFVPALLPENRPERVQEFFSLLCDALTATRNKFQAEVPNWVNEFRFEAESVLLEERLKFVAEIERINNQLIQMERFKRILVLDGEALVEAVAEVLDKGFGLKVSAHNELREDLKILNDDGGLTVLLEVKGTNGGVKRENVNQADSHRERAELPANFPAVLVINTHIKNSRTITEKDQEVPKEQVRHAVRANVLVLRTIDLLGLLRLHKAEKLPREKFLQLISTSTGWLRVAKDEVEVVTG